jgi:hypothetical protein
MMSFNFLVSTWVFSWYDGTLVGVTMSLEIIVWVRKA